MLMAQRAPQRLSGVVLNDIGPHLDKRGLVRIAQYVGLSRELDTWEDAVALLRQTNAGFDGLDSEQWLAYAKRVFTEVGGRPKVDYDLALASALPPASTLARDGLPDLWRAFSALKGMPAAVLRGQHSDLLSAATVARMKKLVPSLLTATVADRGHVPFLDEPESVAAINQVLSACDAARASPHP